MAGNRLAQILEKEYQSQGLISGIGSAMGKRIREKTDIRNAIFGGSGFTGVIGRKVFGKGYSATSGGSSTKSDALSGNISSTLSEQSEELKTISISSKVTAKNTLALPSMARDMYLVKQNIIKLVKLNKGKPQTKAGDWMGRQEARESAFESKFGKSTSPTKVAKKESESSGGGILGLFGGLFEAFGGPKLLGIAAGVTALVTAFLGLKETLDLVKIAFAKVVNWIADTEIGKALGIKPIEGTGGKEKSLKDTLKETYSETLGTVSGVGAVAAGAVAVRGATNAAKAATATSEAVLNARTMSVGQLEKATPKTVWGRFMQFVYKKSPMLFKKVGLKLAQAGALVAIPVVGWVGALLQLGFGIWTAYELYELWVEFNEITENKNNPSAVTKTEEQKNLESYDASIKLYKEKLDNAKTPEEKKALQGAVDSLVANRSKVEAAALKSVAGSGGTPNSPTTGTSGTDYASKVGTSESGGSYNAVFGNTNATLNGKPLSQNTIGEVWEWQKKHIAQHTNKQAAGKYQFMNVLKAAEQAGLSFRDVFSPENQDKMMNAYTASNAARLKQLGYEPTKENLSLAHAVGADGAAKLLATQKAGAGSKVAADVLELKPGAQRTTNPHLNKSTDQVIADAANRVNGTAPTSSPSGTPATSIDGTSLASASSSAEFNPFMEILGQFDRMLSDYHKATKDNQTANFDGGSLETYNEEFLKKLLGVQSFQPNKA